MRLFHYLAPKIYPLFPTSAGKTVFGSFVQHALNTRTEGAPYTGKVFVKVLAFCKGEQISADTHVIAVKDGVSEKDTVWCASDAPSLGYTEIELSAEQPIFRKLHPESGYSLFSGVDGRCLTINTDTKYAHYRVIEQIKAWQNFCLLHSAILVDPARDYGNSMLLINPYERPIVAGLKSTNGRSLRARIPEKSAEIINLEPLVEAGKFGTVMLSANNRLVAYDVRHPYGSWQAFNSIDHLDVFSGIPTQYRASALESLGQLVRKGARRFGLRYV